MKLLCIAVDVSKESSHIQGFYDLNVEASDPIKISHDTFGFGKMNKLIESFFSETSKKVIVVFEDIGVYDKPLQMFIMGHSIRYVTINPLSLHVIETKAFVL